MYHDRELIQEGVAFLRKKFRYTQSDILQKAFVLGYEISHSSFSNILNEKRAGNRILALTEKAICEIVKTELGYIWDEDEAQFVEGDNLETSIISFAKEEKRIDEGLYYYADGRLPLEKEVKFITSAKTEVIILGLTLSHFVNYFITRSSKEFGHHIENILAKGVNVKCYVIDFDSNESRIYFNNEATISPNTSEHETVRLVNVEQLIKIAQNLNSLGYTGKMQILFYKSLPSFACTVIDGSKAFGQMLISHYLFGQRRADAPVLHINAVSQPDLFEKYWKSVLGVMQNAKMVVP